MCVRGGIGLVLCCLPESPGRVVLTPHSTFERRQWAAGGQPLPKVVGAGHGQGKRESFFLSIGQWVSPSLAAPRLSPFPRALTGCSDLWNLHGILEDKLSCCS